MEKILSPITGRVQEVNVKVGQTIGDDDETFIIEAMKMETVAYGVSGVVKEVLVNKGDQVNEDDVLATVE